MFYGFSYLEVIGDLNKNSLSTYRNRLRKEGMNGFKEI